MLIKARERENANHLTRRDIVMYIGNENNRKQRKNVTLDKCMILRIILTCPLIFVQSESVSGLFVC